jgi:ubiquinone/menaquinone biosynthesis C-methylase UbiE
MKPTELPKWLWLAAQQQLSPQRAPRVPEPSEAMDEPEQVSAYQKALETKLALSYKAILYVIRRCRATWQGTTALDVACGPGHFAVWLLRYLGVERLVGVDLSPMMVQAARDLLYQHQLNYRADVICADVRSLSQIFPADSFDLVTFNNAAHHLPDRETVKQALEELDRVAGPRGLLVVADLVRLKTASLCDAYVETLGAEYRKLSLQRFLEDFRASVHAAWTPEELASCIPSTSPRDCWVHWVAQPLPALQILIRLPSGRRKVGPAAKGHSRPEPPVPRGMLGEWVFLRHSLMRRKLSGQRLAASRPWERLTIARVSTS